MIKKLLPADGCKQLEREGGTEDRKSITQGKPCLSFLITAPAVCVLRSFLCSNEQLFIYGKRTSVTPLTAATCNSYTVHLCESHAEETQTPLLDIFSNHFAEQM